jgi:protein TonB
MFDTIVNPSSGVPRQRWTTTALSAAGHLAIAIALILSTIYATDVLPMPREVITFVSVAAPPPPPPPAVAAAEAPAKPAAIRRGAALRPPAVITRAPIAAPVEAPGTIAPETGLEGGEFEPAGIEAGFEHGLPGGIAGGIVGGFESMPLSPPPVPAEPVRVGGAVATPILTYRVEPEYPAIAVNAQIEGMVILEATVDDDGTVKDARVLRSHGVLDAAAVRAVEQWRYEPLLLNGQPTPFILTVTVSFSLAR